VVDLEDKKRQKANISQLNDETAAREARIKNRRKLERKAEAERKSKRRIKMAKWAGFWIAFFVIGLYALTWFSKDFVDWLHKLVN
jgi:hypothetical protein